mgnify:CR=1 FL=1
MPEEQKQQLEQQLWNIANELRWKMSADQFRDYILGFIFYKYLSEKLVIKADKLLEDEGVKYEKIDENSVEWKDYLKAIKEDTIWDLGYFLKPSELFSEISKKWNSKSENSETNFILGDLINILKNIENSTTGTESEEDFIWLFEDLDLTHPKLGRSEEQKNELISRVLAHLDKIDFKLQNTELDVLWDAYEYLIAKFASWAWKQAWEFYTPQDVSKILDKIVTLNKTQIKSVYDPTCGSGSLLLRVAKEVKYTNQVQFFGQELNRTTFNLARMNMILHDDGHTNVISHDGLDDIEKMAKINLWFKANSFKYIFTNPPFWAIIKKSASDYLDKFEFWKKDWKKTRPAQKSEILFIESIHAFLKEGWRCAVVLPDGILTNSSLLYVREWILEHFKLLWVISLTQDAFKYFWAWVKSSILVL